MTWFKTLLAAWFLHSIFEYVENIREDHQEIAEVINDVGMIAICSFFIFGIWKWL